MEWHGVCLVNTKARANNKKSAWRTEHTGKRRRSVHRWWWWWWLRRLKCSKKTRKLQLLDARTLTRETDWRRNHGSVRVKCIRTHTHNAEASRCTGQNGHTLCRVKQERRRQQTNDRSERSLCSWKNTNTSKSRRTYLHWIWSFALIQLRNLQCMLDQQTAHKPHQALFHFASRNIYENVRSRISRSHVSSSKITIFDQLLHEYLFQF